MVGNDPNLAKAQSDLSALLDAALQYLAEGRSIVPVKEGQKAPPHVAWEEYQKRRPTEEEVQAWWEKWPTANIAIVTGGISGITVIDLDGPEGMASARANLLTGQHLETRIHKTPKGHHILCKYDSRFHTGAGFLPGVDVRNDGGYIIAPPSVVDGKEYTVYRDGPIAAIPFGPEALTVSKVVPIRPETEHPTWVSEALRGVPEKERNQTATRLVGYFHSKGIPPDIIFETLMPFAKACEPEMDPRELQKVIASVTQYERHVAANAITDPPTFSQKGDSLFYEWPGLGVSAELEDVYLDKEGIYCDLTIRGEQPGIPPLQHGPVRYNLKTTRSQSELVRHLAGRLEGINWATILEQMARLAIAHVKEGEPIIDLRESAGRPFERYLLDPLVLDSQPTILFGDGGTGKSLLALAILLAIETGNKDILGMAPSIRKKGLLLDWEFNDWEHAERMEHIMNGVWAGIPSNAIAYRRCYLPLHQEVGPIKRYIEENGIGFVVIDSAAAACGEEPEKASEALRFFNALRRLNVTALVVAHQVKKNKDSDMEKPFGSSFWWNMARSVWKLERVQQGNELAIGVYHKKWNVDRQRAPLSYRVNFTADEITFESQSIFENEELASKLSIKIQLQNQLRNGKATVKELAEAIGGKEGSVYQTMNRNRKMFSQDGKEWSLMSKYL